MGQIMSQDDYNAGRNGWGPTQSNDPTGAFDFVRGIKDRMAVEDKPLTGEADPHAPQLVILILGFAATFALLWNSNIFPFEMWQVILLCIAALLVATWILRKMPNWLSGSIMAILLGGFAAYIGWTSGNIYWSVGSGLVVGGLMFRLYSNFD